MADKSLIRMNAEENANYCPYCMRCRGMQRMNKVAPFLWQHHCGAVHDERTEDEMKTGAKNDKRTSIPSGGTGSGQ